jgi:hypothetical protein
LVIMLTAMLAERRGPAPLSALVIARQTFVEIGQASDFMLTDNRAAPYGG